MAQHPFPAHAAAASISLAAGVLVSGRSAIPLVLGCAIALSLIAHYGVTENARLVPIFSMVVIILVAGAALLIPGLWVECHQFGSCAFQ
jgi:hypothetical protein